MRWVVMMVSMSVWFSVQAGECKISKVLVHYLDAKGRHSLSPSLFERDAYQDHLRKNPQERSGLRYDIQWKAKAKPTQAKNFLLRVELRGVKQNAAHLHKIEKAVTKKGGFGNWTSLPLTGADYSSFDEIVAWKVTLWDGDVLQAEEKSFLW